MPTRPGISALRFLATKKSVDAKQIGLWDSSYGGGLVTWITGNDTRPEYMAMCSTSSVFGVKELTPALSQNLPAHLRGFQASKGYPTDRASGDLKDDTRFFQAPVPNMIGLRPLVAFLIVFVVTLSRPTQYNFKRMRRLQTNALICGGGCAEIAAALSSARHGAKTLLIERPGFSGGIITTVGLPYFDVLIDKPSGRFVLRSIPLEFLRKLGVARDGAKHIDDLRPDLITKYWGSVSIPNVKEFKLLSDELILEQSCTLQMLYYSMACDVEVKEGRENGCRARSKDEERSRLFRRHSCV